MIVFYPNFYLLNVADQFIHLFINVCLFKLVNQTISTTPRHKTFWDFLLEVFNDIKYHIAIFPLSLLLFGLFTNLCSFHQSYSYQNYQLTFLYYIVIFSYDFFFFCFYIILTKTFSSIMMRNDKIW